MQTMPTVIFIHGARVTPQCWRYFAPLFADKGYRTLTPAWPFKDRAVGDQRSHPDPRLAKVGIPEIVAHFKAIVRYQSKPPVLIGHSFGGLIVQLLLDQGYGAAGIAISSVPPRGVSALGSSPARAVRKLWKIFGTPSPWPGILPPPPPDAQEKALHQAQGFETFLVPESRRIFWQLVTRAAQVDFRHPARAPLLLVACDQDRCVPVETQQRNWQRHCASPARTDFALFPDLTHLGIAEPGCEALAAYCLAWTDDRLAPSAGGLTYLPRMDARRFPSDRSRCDLLRQPMPAA
jgi:alpha-beta hydrolase superfamily lysophospholipase